jgi:predicted transcriptional regulator
MVTVSCSLNSLMNMSPVLNNRNDVGSYQILKRKNSSSASSKILMDNIGSRNVSLGMASPTSKDIGYVVKTNTEFLNNGIYCMKAMNSHKTVGIVKTTDVQMVQYNKECTSNFTYRFIKDGEGFRMINMRTGRILTETTPKGRYHWIHLKTKNDPNSKHQVWKFVDYGNQQFQVFSLATNYLFDISGDSSKNGKRFFAYRDNHGRSDQRFRFKLVGMFEEPKLSNEVVPNDVARKVGYQVANLNEFFDNGIYCLKSVKSKKAIGVQGDSTNVVQNGDKCDTNYRYRIMRIGESDQYRLESITGKGALSVTDLKTNYQPIGLQPFDENNEAQRWRFSYRVEADRQNKEIQLRNVASNHTLDILYGNVKDGAKVIAWVNNHDHPNERFTITLVDVYHPEMDVTAKGHVVRTHTDLVNNGIYCMKAMNSNKTVGIVKTTDVQMVQHNKKCTSNFTYRFIKDGEGFRMVNMRTGRVLTETTPEGLYHWIHLKTKNDPSDKHQVWKFVDYADNQLQVFSLATNYLFDISGDSSQNGKRFFAYRNNHGRSDQRFSFTMMGMFEEPKLSNEVVPNDVARKVGYQIANLNEFFDRGIYCLKSVKSKKAIGVKGDSNNVVQNGDKCDINYSYRILRIGESDQYRLESMTGRGALSVTDLKTNYQPVGLLPFDENNEAQRWRFSYRVEADRQNKEIQLRNVASNHTLDILYGKTHDGAKVIAWVNNHDHPNERFTITLVDIYTPPSEIPGYVVKTQADFFDEGVYCVKAVNSKKAVGLSCNEFDSKVYQIREECAPEFTYKVVRLENSDEYRLENQSGRGVLTERSAKGAVHSMSVKKWANAKGQKWRFMDIAEGQLQIQSCSTKYMMDIRKGSRSNGADLIAYSRNHKGNNQRFTFTLVSNGKAPSA